MVSPLTLSSLAGLGALAETPVPGRVARAAEVKARLVVDTPVAPEGAPLPRGSLLDRLA